VKKVVDDWEFNYDIQATKDNYKKNNKCNSTPCKNFRKLIKNNYPKLYEFLLKFGVNIERPEEIMWFEGNKNEEIIDYNAWYIIKGEIVKNGNYEIDIDTLNIVVTNSNKGSPNTEVNEPYFWFCVYNIVLPWKMKEDFSNIFPKKQKKQCWFKKILIYLKKI
jgi:hypothetical protein